MLRTESSAILWFNAMMRKERKGSIRRGRDNKQEQTEVRWTQFTIILLVSSSNSCTDLIFSLRLECNRPFLPKIITRLDQILTISLASIGPLHTRRNPRTLHVSNHLRVKRRSWSHTTKDLLRHRYQQYGTCIYPRIVPYNIASEQHQYRSENSVNKTEYHCESVTTNRDKAIHKLTYVLACCDDLLLERSWKMNVARS